MYGNRLRAPKVDVHSFSMVPRADIPRSTFRMQHQHKTTIGASVLIPFYVQEVLPGDAFNTQMTAFCRMATPLYPILDNMDLETFFFFVPCRLVWIHWYKFMGEQDLPTDSISYTIPTVTSALGGFPQLSIFDYFGLPCVGQTGAGNAITVSALPLRAYNLIYNQWFRDENLVNSVTVGSGSLTQVGSTPGYGYVSMDDGPDAIAQYGIQTAAKRHDYFTACLPWTQKGAAGPVLLPLGSSATVRTATSNLITGANPAGSGVGINFLDSAAGGTPTANQSLAFGAAGVGTVGGGASAAGSLVYPSNLYADLSTATGASINAIRLAFQTQRLLERDARGGTRYTEIVRSHFGVMSPDARLMRPEYLGGGKTPVSIAPVPQTTATGLTGGSSPLGTLSAVGTNVSKHGFRYSATEHGYILGLCLIRRDQVYQQGIRRMWKRSTRYDFYMPVFAALGEQSVYNYEIYSDGSANDNLTFGYQERWAEYRYFPSFTSGYFRSTNTTPLDAWHLATKFASLPVLNGSFIADDTYSTLARALAGGALDNNQQFLCDFFFDEKVARPMPMYSVPGLIDHF